MLAVQAGRILTVADVPKLIAAGERALAIGPIVDPTLWREKHEDLEADLELLKAALPLFHLMKQRQSEAKNRAILAER